MYIVSELEEKADKLLAECKRRWPLIKWLSRKPGELLEVNGQTGHYGFRVDVCHPNAIAKIEEQISGYRARVQAEQAALAEAE